MYKYLNKVDRFWLVINFFTIGFCMVSLTACFVVILRGDYVWSVGVALASTALALVCAIFAITQFTRVARARAARAIISYNNYGVNDVDAPEVYRQTTNIMRKGKGTQ